MEPVPHFHSILNGTSNTANIKDALNPEFENAVRKLSKLIVVE
jgi:hypothetical protein